MVDIKGSANNRIHNFINHLQGEHDITVVCPRDVWRAKQVDTENYSGATSEEKSETKYLTGKNLSPILQDIFSRLLITNLDIDYESFDVHLDYNSLFLGYHISNQLRPYNVPSVLDLADDLPAMIRDSPQLPSYLGVAGSMVGEYLINSKVSKYERVTYITKGISEEHKLSGETSQRIPNGVNVSKFKPTSDRLKIEIDADLIVGYVGVNREWVDLSLLVHSIAKLRSDGLDLGLLVVGDEGGIGEIQRLVQRLDIEDAVEFAGTVPYDEVPRYVNSMDIGTIPFKDNGIAKNSLPLKLFEYLACEVPVVSSDIPGVKRAVGNCALIADTQEDWNQSLQSLYENEDTRAQIGTKGRRIVKEEYSWESVSSSMENQLLEVVNNHQK
ncbi:glycosyltransferase [Haloferax sp. DFSO52]|uniref:glycosyltransferase n=1 Tax=Haloferax sp. DFSO52 TaxID=3388505 RepID=UPI003A86645C